MNTQIVNPLLDLVYKIAAFKMNPLWVLTIACITILLCINGVFFMDHSSIYFLLKSTFGIISVTVLEIWNYHLMGQIAEFIVEVINDFLVIF